MNKNILIILVILIILPICYAEIQTLGTFKVGECINLKQTCGNCTYNNITSVQIDGTSNQLLDLVEMEKIGTEYNYTFCNTTNTGTYIVNGLGNVDGTPTVWAYDFKVTPNGEDSNVGSAILYIGVLAVLIIFLILSIYSFVTFDNLLNRVGMLGLSYLFLIAITFIGWNMANDFLTSAPFLVEMLRILFFVLIIGAFPLLIGSFAYYFIMLFKIKEIERLMGKGMSGEEAERRVKHK